MAEPLTRRQQNVLDYVRQSVDILGVTPTLREIAESQNLQSASNIHRILHELEKKGYLQLRSSSYEVRRTDDAEVSTGFTLTSDESRIYDALVRSIGKKGRPPTLREIRDRLGDISLRKVQYLLEALEAKNRVILRPSQANGISLVVPDSKSLFPVVVQGVPCDASNFLSSERTGAKVWSLPLPRLFPSFVEADIAGVFGVTLLDNRALEGYSAGDTLIASRSRKPKRGDIVVAKYHERVIARRYRSYRSVVTLSAHEYGAGRKLKPSSSAAADIRVESSEVEILGVVFTALARL